VSGRHSKSAFHRRYSSQLKTAGGALTAATLAGAIAASTAAATPATAQRFPAKESLAGMAAIRVDDGRRLSPHEAHSKHNAHNKRVSRGDSRADEPTDSKSSKRKERTKRVSAQSVLDLARDQIGTRENRSGETKFNKWFMRDSRARATVERDGGSLSSYKDASWCDMFVSWIGNELGISPTMGFDAYTPKHAEWFKDHGRWGKRPRPGSVAFFSWDGDKIDDIEHVGFTIKDNGDGTIKTVEGNTHNEVAIKKRKKSFVVGYGYPDYKK
jgi:hypothetical protein